VWTIFEDNTLGLQLVPDTIGLGKVLGLAGCVSLIYQLSDLIIAQDRMANRGRL
jgi:hypothetical protein